MEIIGKDFFVFLQTKIGIFVGKQISPCCNWEAVSHEGLLNYLQKSIGLDEKDIIGGGYYSFPRDEDSPGEFFGTSRFGSFDPNKLQKQIKKMPAYAGDIVKITCRIFKILELIFLRLVQMMKH
jgi:hypothetical protein